MKNQKNVNLFIYIKAFFLKAKISSSLRGSTHRVTD